MKAVLGCLPEMGKGLQQEVLNPFAIFSRYLNTPISLVHTPHLLEVILN